MSHAILPSTGLMLILTAAAGAAEAQQPPPAARAETHTRVPAQAPWSPSVIQRLKAPEGFRLEVFADQLGKPRMIAVAENGTVYVTRRDSNDVLAIPVDQQGKAGTPRKIAAGLTGVHGIAIGGGQIFLATVREVYVAELPRGDSGMIRPRAIITNLPEGGQHPNRTLAIGPDRMLYISVGSTCNQCIETSPENATLLRARLDGSERGVYARGLRNTVGWAWHPETGELWGLDHGSDHHGNEWPPEELNRLAAGAHYGWPFCDADRRVDSLFAQNPPGSTKEEFCPRTVRPGLMLPAHAAPIQLVFYQGRDFPAEYRGDGFATLRGSWNRESPVGYQVVRIRFQDGRPVKVEDFITGFLSEDGSTHYGRLAGLAVMKDGSLLVGDDTNGVIYRVSHGAAMRAAARNRE